MILSCLNLGRDSIVDTVVSGCPFRTLADEGGWGWGLFGKFKFWQGACQNLMGR